MKVKEIFFSIQGESSSMGLPTIFVRFSGCNLRCRYCDTRYSYDGGEELEPQAIYRRLQAWPCRRICLTGGEPLLQEKTALKELLALLKGYELSIETNGSLPLDGVLLGPEHRWVVDIKCPGSGMENANYWDNLKVLRPQDEVKFVLMDEEDYLWAREVIRRERLEGRVRLLLAPAYGVLKPRELAEWILRDGVEARLQLQLHKLIFGADARGV
ncbi:MAG: 7-carboxy-7-deazaguanine synthase [Clostridia bacterium]|nr:7-carboxy-7-deazaguanine synthase [Clostridia bacterium]